jgi:hypothetical protein
MCLPMIGIIADMEPNTAKHNAKAPVPRASCRLGEDLSCMTTITFSTIAAEQVHYRTQPILR